MVKSPPSQFRVNYAKYMHAVLSIRFSQRWPLSTMPEHFS